jgi:hypothetical protein
MDLVARVPGEPQRPDHRFVCLRRRGWPDLHIISQVCPGTLHLHRRVWQRPEVHPQSFIQYLREPNTHGAAQGDFFYIKYISAPIRPPTLIWTHKCQRTIAV